MEDSKFGTQVAQLANRMKVKQTRIAMDCEISRISVNRFFRGRSEIRASDLVNVLKVLGIDLEQEIERRLAPVSAQSTNANLTSVSNAQPTGTGY